MTQPDLRQSYNIGVVTTDVRCRINAILRRSYYIGVITQSHLTKRLMVRLQ